MPDPGWGLSHGFVQDSGAAQPGAHPGADIIVRSSGVAQFAMSNMPEKTGCRACKQEPHGALGHRRGRPSGSGWTTVSGIDVDAFERMKAASSNFVGRPRAFKHEDDFFSTLILPSRRMSMPEAGSSYSTANGT